MATPIFANGSGMVSYVHVFDSITGQPTTVHIDKCLIIYDAIEKKNIAFDVKLCIVVHGSTKIFAVISTFQVHFNERIQHVMLPFVNFRAEEAAAVPGPPFPGAYALDQISFDRKLRWL